MQVKERLRHAKDGPLEEIILRKIDAHRGRFLEAMDDDFNTAEALGALFQFSKEVNIILNSGQEISLKALQEIDSLYSICGGEVLGIVTDTTKPRAGGDQKGEEALINLLIETREGLRRAKQWQLADEVRNKLGELGVILEDKPEGAKWRRKL